MGLPKGRTNNRAGRPAGSPNKITTELREGVHSGLSSRLTKFWTKLDRLEDKDYCLMMEKMMSYVLPKMASTTVTTNTGVVDEVPNEQLTDLVKEFSKRKEALKIVG